MYLIIDKEMYILGKGVVRNYFGLDLNTNTEKHYAL